MQLFRNQAGLKHYANQFGRKSVITLGNFDGFHLGHRALFARVTEIAVSKNLHSVAMFFEPHADEFFRGTVAKPRLVSLRDKLSTFKQSKLDSVACIRFDQQFSELSAQKFIDYYLKPLNISHIIVGENFRFGNNREGGIDSLRNWIESEGGSIEPTPLITHQSERISSTRIRKELAQGNFEQAKNLLGYAWSYCSKVIYGQQKGRLLGFPTANLALRSYQFPLKGVYAGWAWKEDSPKIRWPSVANVGNRPTVSKDSQSFLEVHILGKNDLKLYGQRIRFEPVQKLRDEMKFSGLDELKTQVEADKLQAQQLLTP